MWSFDALYCLKIESKAVATTFFLGKNIPSLSKNEKWSGR
jgi:hypothetical protein